MNNTSGSFSRGYLSEEHKKKFTITVGVLGGIFLVGMFVIPFLLMIIPIIMTDTDSGNDIYMSHAELWNGAIWYVETNRRFSDSVRTNTLRKIPLDNDHESIEIGTFTGENTWLLKNSDRLWIISDSEVGWYKNGEMSTIPIDDILSRFGRPFLYYDKPAIIEEMPDYYQLRIFADGSWRPGKRLFFRLQNIVSSISKPKIQIISKDYEFYVFMYYDERLYFRTGLPTAPDDTVSWHIIEYGHREFYATFIDGYPAVFSPSHLSGYKNLKTTGMILSGDSAWKEFCTLDIPHMYEFAVFPLERERYIIASSTSYSSVITIRAMNRNIIDDEIHHGTVTSFPDVFTLLIFIPYLGIIFGPIILAIIFTFLMKKHKVTEYRYEEARVPFASLIRRALAQIIDAAIIVIPYIIVYIVLFVWLVESVQTYLSGMYSILWIFFAGLLWTCCWFLVYSYLEGRYGKTPGKWIMGIQVLGIDLKPCGFGRALIRNVLTFVDGFFNFMVGVMIIALNENWQRVGDMAARTVVIDSRKIRV